MENYEITYEFTNNDDEDSLRVFIKGTSSFSLGGFTLRPSFIDPTLDNQNIEIDSITGTNNFFTSPNPNDGINSGFSTSESGVQSYSRDNKDGEWLEIARYKFNQIIKEDIQVRTDVIVGDFFLSNGTDINILSDTKNISSKGS